MSLAKQKHQSIHDYARQCQGMRHSRPTKEPDHVTPKVGPKFRLFFALIVPPAFHPMNVCVGVYICASKSLQVSVRYQILALLWQVLSVYRAVDCLMLKFLAWHTVGLVRSHLIYFLLCCRCWYIAAAAASVECTHCHFIFQFIKLSRSIFPCDIFHFTTKTSILISDE